MKAALALALTLSCAPAPARNPTPARWTMPPPPGDGWRPVASSSSELERQTYPVAFDARSGYTSAAIVAPIAGWERRDASATAFAYRVAKKEPASIVEHCCPDGGLDLFLAVAKPDGKSPILLVSWGLQEARSEREAMLREWAKSVEASLGP